MHQWISLLSQNNVGRVLENESLAKYTTWKIGGPADALVIPENKEQMMNLVQLLHTYQIPWMQLGRGSNMLVSDKGIRGVVVKPGEGFDYAEFHEGGVTAGAAHSLLNSVWLLPKRNGPVWNSAAVSPALSVEPYT